LADYLSRMYNGEDPDKYLTTNEQCEQLVGHMLLETIMTTQLGENVENEFIDEFQDSDIDTDVTKVNEGNSIETRSTEYNELSRESSSIITETEGDISNIQPEMEVEKDISRTVQCKSEKYISSELVKQVNEVLKSSKQKKQVTIKEPVNIEKHGVDFYLKQCHGGRRMHGGVRRTWITLNKEFPGHQISHRQVADFVAECPICQKFRSSMQDYVEPLTKHLK